MNYLMGIDGGGSNLRVAITTWDLEVLVEYRAGTANPSVIGRETAAKRIQNTMREAIQQARLAGEDIGAVGIGIAGASAAHSREWLCEVVSGVLPKSVVAPSSDIEIALVGAHGERQGILILAGTGSVAYGVNEFGKSVQVGGWGYLVGDEGSGYWIGKQALAAIVQAMDGRGETTLLTNTIVNQLELEKASDVIGWLYGSEKPPVKPIAELAELVLNVAEANDLIAQQIIKRAAQHLADHCTAAQKRLQMPHAKISFAGGLLETHNMLSNRLMQLLGLDDFPKPLYSPVIGAALLAKLALDL